MITKNVRFKDYSWFINQKCTAYAFPKQLVTKNVRVTNIYLTFNNQKCTRSYTKKLFSKCLTKNVRL